MTSRQAAIQIVRSLRKSGFEALLAGGCVRDMLRGRVPNDYDVATGATPAQVCRIFRRTIRVGAKFGVVIVLIDGHQVEVATFRADAGYSDGRRPDKIIFTSAREDALRRDFTINGMFYDPLKKEVIDYVGGRADLKKKIIRTIGKPAERFSEDFLRMLRAIRFSAQLNFAIEKQTLSTVKKYAGSITAISGERIAIELESLCGASNRKKGVELLMDTGLLKRIFPVFGRKSVAGFALKVFDYLPRQVTFELAVGALFSGCDTCDAMENLNVLKLSRNQLKHIRFLLEKRDFLLGDLFLAQLKMVVSEPYFEDLYLFQVALQKAVGKSVRSLSALRRRANALAGKELRPRPLLNGNELIQLGARPGPQVGLVAKELYIEQLSERVAARPEAVEWVRDWLRRHKG